MPANPSSRTSSFASSADTTPSSANNAALLGAATAFGRQPPRPRATKPTASNIGSGSIDSVHGATASSAGHGGKHEQSPAHSSALIGSHVMNEKASTDTLRVATSGDVRPAGHDRSRSHSQQAAALATARAKPSVPPQTQRTMVTGQRPAVGPKASNQAYATTDNSTDTTSIAPTTSLVDLFEKRSKTAAAPAKRPEPVIIKSSNALPLRSPKPVRSGGITSLVQLEGRSGKQTGPSETNAGPNKVTPDQYDGQRHSSNDAYASASEQLDEQTPLPRLPKAVPRALSPSPGDRWKAQNESKWRARASPSPQRVPHALPIPIHQHPPPRPISAQSTGISVSSMRSHMSIPAQFNAAYPRKMTPLRAGDDLANALVASSLASSRAPSPTRLEPPPVPTRRRKGGQSKFSFSRTPSPTKVGMLHTLRKAADTSSSESQDEKHPYRKHHKKRLVRKHPNKHHEGDRKRWRDAVTERQRKRYEGVWAANKGLHYSFSVEEQDFFRKWPQHEWTQDAKAAASDSVSSLVTRDIWKRSRLPGTVLELIWDLVDNDGVGRLCKEEFVIGMWLIDQRLKGRKLPIKVSESVWASVRGIGIKVRR